MLTPFRKALQWVAFLFLLTLAACSQNTGQDNRAPVAVIKATTTATPGETVSLDGSPDAALAIQTVGLKYCQLGGIALYSSGLYMGPMNV